MTEQYIAGTIGILGAGWLGLARAATGAGPAGGRQAGSGQQRRQGRLIWPAQRCREWPTKSPALSRAGG